MDRQKAEPKDFFPLVSINAAGKPHSIERLAPPPKITFSIQVASYEFHHPEPQKLNIFFEHFIHEDHYIFICGNCLASTPEL